MPNKSAGLNRLPLDKLGLMPVRFRHDWVVVVLLSVTDVDWSSVVEIVVVEEAEVEVVLLNSAIGLVSLEAEPLVVVKLVLVSKLV